MKQLISPSLRFNWFKKQNKTYTHNVLKFLAIYKHLHGSCTWTHLKLMKIVLSLLTNRPVSVPSHFEIIVQFKRIKTKKKKNSDIICFLKTLLSKVDNKDFGHLDLCSINIFIKTLPILGLCGTCCRLPLLTLQTGNSVVLNSLDYVIWNPRVQFSGINIY